MKEKFNWQRHPEIESGEMFLTNSDIDGYENIHWETKRKGDVAYDINGNIIKGMFPVFISREEYKKKYKGEFD